MKFLFDEVFYKPLYNALFGIIDILPGAEIGLAVIILTVIVKFILFPLSASSIRTQIKMKEIDPELKKIQAEYKDNREELGRKMLDLYRKNKVNPFAGIFLVLIQIPVVLALYFVFSNGLSQINVDLLYSFVPKPEFIQTTFLGFIDLSANKNILIALLAGLSQYFQMKIIMDGQKKNTNEIKEKTMADELMKTMQFQMKYIMPIVTFFISFTLISVIGLYWLVSNLLAIIQEIYIRKNIKNQNLN
jgi:YidC/Oxa1 family membrane protein insertase